MIPDTLKGQTPAQESLILELRAAGWRITPPAELAAQSIHEALTDASGADAALRLAESLNALRLANPRLAYMAPSHLFQRLCEDVGMLGNAMLTHTIDADLAALKVAEFALAICMQLRRQSPRKAHDERLDV
jgi:hypothetical protein